jgi:hypothetical protein
MTTDSELISRSQQVLDDINFRLCDLVRLIAELATPEASRDFYDACVKINKELIGRANLAVNRPTPEPELRSIVPPGRRFQVSYATDTGRDRCWYWPDAGDGIFTDAGFNRIEVPERVRAYMREHVAGEP